MSEFSPLTRDGRVPLISWLVVGLTAGLVAPAVGNWGSALFVDVVAGMLGAILGVWLVTAFRIQNPLDGLPRAILLAFIGATILLIVFRASGPRRRALFLRMGSMPRTRSLTDHASLRS